MLLLGHGNRRSCDPEAVRVFAERTRIPVVTTMGARGEFPNDSDLYLGVVGEGGHPRPPSTWPSRTSWSWWAPAWP
ncbi:hypothetical protein ACFQ3Z_13960 [Streptomyces nogalater]